MVRHRVVVGGVVAALAVAACVTALSWAARPDRAGPPPHAGPPAHAGPPDHANAPDHAGPPDPAGPKQNGGSGQGGASEQAGGSGQGGASGQAGSAPGPSGTAPAQSGSAPGQSGPSSGGGPVAGSGSQADAGAGTALPVGDPLPEAEGPPVLAEAAVARPERGTVLVRLPGSGQLAPLQTLSEIPVGSLVDARKGRLVLRTALPDGGEQTIVVGDGQFTLRQGRDGMTSLLLQGGDFSTCPSAGRASAAPRASAARAKKRGKRSEVRRLFTKDDSGKFRTHGANSVATVRGTEWLTIDRCDGTLTVVRDGRVAVRDERRDRTVVVRAGERYLARATS